MTYGFEQSLKRFGFNSYKLKIVFGFEINFFINLEDLTAYQPSIDYPIVIYNPSILIFARFSQFHSPLQRRLHIEEIENII